LWTNKNIIRTGINDYGCIKISSDDVEFAFSPGEGSAASSLFVDAIQGEARKIWISSMVISSGTILGSLHDFLERGGVIEGIYDETQMRHIEHTLEETNSPVLELWNHIKVNLVGKKSTPISVSSPHDFMHNKVLVTDNTVVTGSFNLSHNAELNAENALSIHDEGLAKKYQVYIENLIKKYNIPEPERREHLTAHLHN